MTARVALEAGDDISSVVAHVTTLLRRGTPVQTCREGGAVTYLSPCPGGCCVAVRIDGVDDVLGLVPAAFAIASLCSEDIECLDGTLAAPEALLPTGVGAANAVRYLFGLPLSPRVALLRDLPHIREA